MDLGWVYSGILGSSGLGMGGIVTQHEGEYELPSPPTLDHSGTCTQSWWVVFITFIGC